MIVSLALPQVCAVIDLEHQRFVYYDSLKVGRSEGAGMAGDAAVWPGVSFG